MDLVKVGECETCKGAVVKRRGKPAWRCECSKEWQKIWKKEWVRLYDLGEHESEPQ